MPEQLLMAERSEQLVSRVNTSRLTAAVIMVFSIRWFPSSPTAWKIIEGAAIASLLILVGLPRAAKSLRSPPIVYLLVFGVAGLLSELFDDPSSSGLLSAAAYLVTIAVAATWEGGDSLRGIELTMWLLRVFLGVSLLVFVLPFEHVFENRARGFPLDAHPNELGAVAALLLVLEVYAWHERRSAGPLPVRRIVADVVLILTPVATLAATDSRTAAVTAVAGLTVFAVFNRWTWRWIAIGLIVLTPIVAVTEVRSDTVSGLFEERYESADGSVLSGRTRAWRIVLERLDDPTLGPVLGHGPSQTLVPTPGVERPEQGIDSAFFLSLSVAGIIGAIAVVGFILHAGLDVWKDRAARPDLAALFVMLVVSSLGQSEIAIIGPMTAVLILRFRTT